MKRHEALQKISREHHESLKMAKKMLKVAQQGSDQAVNESIQVVKDYYENELEEHFQHEEHTIFAPIFKEYREHVGLATPLLKEHGFIRLLMQRITPGAVTAREDLGDFAAILKDHTRVEERELFPIVEELFTDEQFQAVIDFTPL